MSNYFDECYRDIQKLYGCTRTRVKVYVCGPRRSSKVTWVPSSPTVKFLISSRSHSCTVTPSTDLRKASISEYSAQFLKPFKGYLPQNISNHDLSRRVGSKARNKFLDNCDIIIRSSLQTHAQTRKAWFCLAWWRGL